MTLRSGSTSTEAFSDRLKWPSSMDQPVGGAPRIDHATPAASPTGVAAGVGASVGFEDAAGAAVALARTVGPAVAGAADGVCAPQPASVRATVAPTAVSLPMLSAMSVSLLAAWCRP
jgi:hypothetical protein